MNNQLINFMIPKRLLKDLDKVARFESRSRAELLREAARQYINNVRQSKDEKDPMIKWQERCAKKLEGWDTVRAIREMRDRRWKLS